MKHNPDNVFDELPEFSVTLNSVVTLFGIIQNPIISTSGEPPVALSDTMLSVIKSLPRYTLTDPDPLL